MTAHAHTESDADLVALKASGWRIRLIPNPYGNTTLEAIRPDTRTSSAVRVQVTERNFEDAVRELAAAARSAR